MTGFIMTDAVSSRLNEPPAWNSEEKFLKIYLKGRPVPLCAPTNIEDEGPYDVKAPQDPPAQQLKLEWVYGYRGGDCMSNLYTIATGEVIYFSAAVVVLHNFAEQTQRHYTEHNNDVKSLAIHPDQVKVATGQVTGHEKKGKAHVRVWESINLTTLHVIGEGEFQRNVCCVSFSPVDGNNLLAVDESNEHILSVWDVSRDNKFSKITDCKSSNDPVTQCAFHPKEENQIVCCGKSQITFWTLEGERLSKKGGIFGHEHANTMQHTVPGTNKISKAIPNAHDGDVFSICCSRDGTILSGGGTDRKIIQWDAEFQKTGVENEASKNAL
ncbi:hypothetical protein DPMN_102003 [Dreissena polymorpha]|uniref:EML-like first beta-propeller domain-containing protein n=1 Tax=Dreissena polymorpha TaxID=45954 RepID=A0A9D4LJR0_DREPO|nr:hypothetical protein DPMN_102003 [Dreissena polymorpha]